MSDFRLKVFQSVAKNLSFTKASQELFVSQPAITKHIQELETYYQARLFERQGSKISLTDAGELLLKHSEKILDDYKQLEYEMHLLHNEYIGELRLGASTTIAQYVLPPLLGNFIAKFPQVNLSLINGNSRGVETALQEHRIDLGLVEGIFRLPNLKYTSFLQDELLIAMDHNNLRNMARFVGSDPEHKVSLLMDHTRRPGDVADPWYTGDFEATWQDVLEGCTALLEELR